VTTGPLPGLPAGVPSGTLPPVGFRPARLGRVRARYLTRDPAAVPRPTLAVAALAALGEMVPVAPPDPAGAEEPWRDLTAAAGVRAQIAAGRRHLAESTRLRRSEAGLACAECGDEIGGALYLLHAAVAADTPDAGWLRRHTWRIAASKPAARLRSLRRRLRRWLRRRLGEGWRR